ncbi:helix-turn-helix transcriptional regulator [Defluviimonas sp. WL0002]|uniref:Helix-turn-helix transcriptional regulator n=1 Tax=Albidovulum marisflavi TaxID=2984159 RepID=A0ABT2ZA93_9RHOB|nr:helix-turn-helix transcriptional regulator [Defluviimonas sp. WL0002]MCV2867993.1 helix-turn-helix transcriptional regulator [Defluviimonas sp. WL0002]
MIEVVASWSEGLHGNASLDVAFAALVRGLGAEAGAIVRTYPGRPFPQIVALHDERAGDPAARPLRGSHATNLFGAHLQTARPASIWLATEHSDESDPVAGVGLHVWQVARHMREMAVLILTSDPSFRDHIELHFHDRLDDDAQALLDMLLPSIVRIWTGRKVGLVTAQVVEKKIKDAPKAPNAVHGKILDVSNPAGLSRAEFRVCVMLSRGLSVKGVTGELGLSDATVRSHLRSIYSKTVTRSLAELVFRLLDQGDQKANVTLRRA